MIGMNITIIRVIRRSREFRKSTVRNKSTNRKLKKFDVKLTKMLLCTSVYFLFATLPISIYFIVDSYQEDLDDVSSAQMDLVWTVSYLLQFSNYTINFFLYNLTNERFRNKFIDTIKCKSTEKKRKSSKNGSVYSVQTVETSLGTEISRVSEETSSGE
uniref:Muscarinic acetylcholine receptor gar-3-like n=1 Tax=Crassostrea virginica TaxID=6565 RepID=A0A8B8DH24_CRAVI|nr:muscarinic acetylcholine receptor gar-3-like [Crassostrea virginica]